MVIVVMRVCSLLATVALDFCAQCRKFE